MPHVFSSSTVSDTDSIVYLAHQQLFTLCYDPWHDFQFHVSFRLITMHVDYHVGSLIPTPVFVLAWDGTSTVSYKETVLSLDSGDKL